MKLELDLTDKELMHLRAAVNQYFHDMKAKLDDETYGPLITDERVLTAREVWKKVEREVNSEW